MQISTGKVVSIDYTLTNDAGDVIDTSAGGEPLTYLQGSGQIIPGLEQALEGKAADDSVQATIAPEDGYGVHEESLIAVVSMEKFESTGGVEEGMQFQGNTESGTRIFTVTKVEGDNITVDGNHPLAGETLNFDVTVRDVRDATDEEMAHGHAHGPGGHHHH